MKRIWIVVSFAIVVFFSINMALDNTAEHNYVPPKGYVPDDTTALKIADAILTPIYGKDLNWQKPYSVKLIGDTTWIVTGRFPKNAIGGVAHIEIRKSDCKIIRVTHGK